MTRSKAVVATEERAHDGLAGSGDPRSSGDRVGDAVIHVLEPDARTLHGYFSRELPPVLEIDPGDTVVFRTLDAGWGLEPHRAGPYQPRRELERGPQDGHAL